MIKNAKKHPCFGRKKMLTDAMGIPLNGTAANPQDSMQRLARWVEVVGAIPSTPPGSVQADVKVLLMLCQQLIQQNNNQANQLYSGLFLSLVNTITADFLRNQDEWKDDTLDIEKITALAKTIAVRAVQKLGIKVEEGA